MQDQPPAFDLRGLDAGAFGQAQAQQPSLVHGDRRGAIRFARLEHKSDRQRRDSREDQHGHGDDGKFQSSHDNSPGAVKLPA